MRVDRLAPVLALLTLLTGTFAQAQGFAGLGADQPGFARPDPDRVLEFPRDHGAHPDFRIEWWYLTATLSGADGQDYGVQWTLFRTALRPPRDPGDGNADTAVAWSSPQIWLAHAALTSADSHLFAQRLARGGIGTAGVRADPFAAWIDGWQMLGHAGPGADALSALELSAQDARFGYDLSLTATAPPVLHGEAGYSVKSGDGQASRYYSQPRYTVTGDIRIDDRTIAVTGKAWLDREWSSQPLAREQAGWDWMALELTGGDRLMVAQVREDRPPACTGHWGGRIAALLRLCPRNQPTVNAYRFGTWIPAQGPVRALHASDISLTALDTAPVAGRDIPVRWRVKVPSASVDVEIRALNPGAWMGTSPPYWEGPVAISGSHQGRGYLEMTGYGPRR
ncbi:MAG: lipocalin-like domain-containing protein [Marinibacterium sp.]